MRSLSWKRRVLRRASEADRSRLSVERLEARVVPDALDPGLFVVGAAAGPAVASIYMESNNPTPDPISVPSFDQSSDGGRTECGAFNARSAGDQVPAAFGSIPTGAAALFGSVDALVCSAIPDFDEVELAGLMSLLLSTSGR